MKKKVDNRVRTLVENCIKTNHRSFFVIVGDRGRDQVVNLHYMISKITTKKPSVLWCYKKELGFSSHKRKRMKDIKKKIQKGAFDANIDDPFEMFVSSTNIRYCFYKESQNILGQTFGMCVLQDFEALTPNILCRAVETVEGGGTCVLLLKSMSSLRQLYSLAMDVHNKYRTENNLDVQPRFNERFILSLAELKDCLVVDDELNILPLSLHAADVKPLTDADLAETSTQMKAKKELESLRRDYEDDVIIGPLLASARTVCQAKAIITLHKPLVNNQTRGTVAVTAARGRGKSASLGFAIAAAIAKGVSNVAVVAPVPENVSTLFEFVVKGLDVLGYEHHKDYHITHQATDYSKVGGNVNHSTNFQNQNSQQLAASRRPSRIEIFKKGNRQVIEYFPPEVAANGRGRIAELLVVDEAASIPLPRVKQIIGDGIVYLASTVQGYEGTGRSLSLKLLSDIKKNAFNANKSSKTASSSLASSSASSSLQTFDEIVMEEPIRYSPGDNVEGWLNDVLCLNATDAFPLSSSTSSAGLPPPVKCQLYQIDRDALFSGHGAAESFLRSLMALFVSSHYKNSPNDLQMLADAPAHRVFALLPPVSANQSTLPDALVAIQISIEGAIGKDATHRAMSRGQKPAGDLIPWTLAQTFADEDFTSLSGVRIVRIATHPSLQRMGYGVEAMRQLMQLLGRANGGPLGSLNERGETANSIPRSLPTSVSSAKKASKSVENDDENDDEDIVELTESDRQNLATEIIAPRSENSIALLRPAATLAFPGPIDYVGVSFGLTQQLLTFWRRLGYVPSYIRSTPCETTGEHSAIMVKPLRNDDETSDDEDSYLDASTTSASNKLPSWLLAFNADFRQRLLSLYSGSLKSIPTSLALSLIGHPDSTPSCGLDSTGKKLVPLTAANLPFFLSEVDILRLSKYASQLADLTLVQDLIPTISNLYFSGRLNASSTPSETNAVSLSAVQSVTLLGLGSMRKSVDELIAELNLPANQVMALFNKSILQISTAIEAIRATAAAAEVDKEAAIIQKQMDDAVSKVASKKESKTSSASSLPVKSFAQEQRDEAKAMEKQGANVSLNNPDVDAKRKAILGAALRKFDLSGIDEEQLKKVSAGKSGKKEGFSVAVKRTVKDAPPAEDEGKKKKAKKF